MSKIAVTPGMNSREFSGSPGGSTRATYLVQGWLLLLSAATALAVTVALFDRTTLGGVSKLWLASALICLSAAWAWWSRPHLQRGSLSFAVYEPASMVSYTFPILAASAGFATLVYASESFHNYVHHLLYYAHLLSDSTWPVGLFTVLFLISMAVALLRRFLTGVGEGESHRAAALRAIVDMRSVIPVGLAACALLLSTTALMMINVNFWRYWATADGWTTIGHYPYTLTDIRHVIEGGVAPYFISFPLLPASLATSYQIIGHDTLASYLPIIVANTLLPVGTFLILREITGNHLLALLFSLITASLPLLRNYTMDVGEADSLLMSTVVFAAYFRIRANRSGAGPAAQVLAGLSAGVAAFTRAEGSLYVLPMYLASMVVRWRSRRFWLSVVVLGATVAVFVVVCLREFGMVWPGNHSGTIALANFASTLEVARQSRVFSMYAQALGVSDLVLALLIAGILGALALSSVRMLRKDFQLLYMPVVALGNVVMVFFVGPIPAEAAKFHDFFRHMSYGFPLLIITLGYGLNEALGILRGKWAYLLRPVAYGTLVAVVLAQLSLLEGPVTPGVGARSPLMTSDVHVSATQLLVDRYPLPRMTFRMEGAKYIPDMPEYMAVYPDDVYQHYKDVDVRRSGNAADYYASTRVIFLCLLLIGVLPAILNHMAGLAAALATDRQRPL